jgi:hypothetical protein
MLSVCVFTSCNPQLSEYKTVHLLVAGGWRLHFPCRASSHEPSVLSSRIVAQLHVRSPAIRSLDPVLWSGTPHQQCRTPNAVTASLPAPHLLHCAPINLPSSPHHPRTRNRVRPRCGRSALNAPAHLNKQQDSIDLTSPSWESGATSGRDLLHHGEHLHPTRAAAVSTA